MLETTAASSSQILNRPPPLPIRSQRGPVLRTRSWRTEGLLRMLENVLEVGERPDDLIVYAALGKAARDWPSFHRIVAALKTLPDDRTLLIQSGKPIAVFPTHADAPRVLMANSNLVGRWATPEHFYALEKKGLICWGGLTAGPWQYIGFQGVLQGTYETFAAVARNHFDAEDLHGRWVVTSGLGGMSAAQPLAVTLLDGVALIAEVDGARARAKVEAHLCDEATEDLDAAIDRALAARESGRARSIAWIGNVIDLHDRLLQRDMLPDVITDMTSAHDALFGYQPADMTLAEAETLRRRDPDRMVNLARDSMVRHVKQLLEYKRRGQVVFDYGNNLRSQARDHGFPDGFQFGVFTELYLRPLFCQGIGPFRWVALSGDPADLAFTDDLVATLYDSNRRLKRWFGVARSKVPMQGLPARTAWLGHGERTEVALRINQAVADGRLSGPIAFSRDQMDAAAMAHPNVMTENLLDGSDAVADWPLLNGLLNAVCGADLVALHQGGGGYAGYSASSGVTIIADGSPTAAMRIERTMNADTGLGILRYADAGYSLAGEAGSTAHERGDFESLQPLPRGESGHHGGSR
jgi:urocanate hydratase